MIHENPPPSYTASLDSRYPTHPQRLEPRPEPQPLPMPAEDQHHDAAPEHQPREDPLADIYGSSPPAPSPLGDAFSGNGGAVAISTSTGNEDVSDIPRLRSIHVTAGYRDGITESKATFMQQGFDEGFTLGAELGLHVGWVLGALEALVLALHDGLKATMSKPGVLSGVRRVRGLEGKVGAGSNERQVNEQQKSWAEKLVDAKRLLILARKELKTEGVFAREYFDETGIWKFHVSSEETASREAMGKQGMEDDDVTFKDVARDHPLIQKWTTTIRDIGRDWNVDLDAVIRNFGEES